jgi:hypothetical protein
MIIAASASNIDVPPPPPPPLLEPGADTAVLKEIALLLGIESPIPEIEAVDT